ncbi:50S ribosomal protein L9 [Candidatus Nomurabacteria bacterium]|nr:50S ribosomal protein L9 [Candidatus Nomurabacteria bacterium]MCB9820651.1 50S ribosomal protein L9 [Candidatus Nomurabacteria bacterium]
MKVIFIKDVPRMGQKNTIKDVPEGYARNFLIAKGLAVPASESAIKNLEKQIKAVKENKENMVKDMVKNLDILSGKTIQTKQKSNEKGVLFKALHQKEIVDILKENNIDLDLKYLKLEKPIKELGVYNLKVEFEKKKIEFILEIIKP